MEHDGTRTAIAVWCDPSGTVIEVTSDTADLGLSPGRTFTEVVATEYIAAGLSLLADAGARHAGQARQIGLRDTSGRPVALLFVAAAEPTSGRMLLVGAADPSELLRAVSTVTDADGAVGVELRRQAEQAVADADDEAVLIALSGANNELVGMHRELARTNAELEQLNRRKDEILGMVAHDLRNPLGSLAGFGEALQRELEPSLDDRSRLMFQRIQGLSRRMLALVDDLLDTVTIESGALRLDLERTDVGALLADTVDSHRPAATRKGLRVLTRLPQEPATAEVDRNRLVQVVDNLLSNAVKFTPADSGAAISIACTGDDDGMITITVTDEGVGLDPSQRDRLFVPFGTPSRTGTDEEPGTGLGLAITKSIVDAHGGTIQVVSEVGRGTSVVVRLPRRPSDTIRAAP